MKTGLNGKKLLVSDQAENLRQMQKSETSQRAKNTSNKGNHPILISVTSGKGGVGKSNFALNTSIALASFGRKVLLIDADTNLANLDILLGLNPQYNMADVFTGDKVMEDILLRGPENIHILPGSSGMIEMFQLEDQVQNQLMASYSNLESNYEYVIIDTGAGLTKHIIGYTISSDEVIIVTNREPTAITDAYAMIKLISHSAPNIRIHLLVNLVKSTKEAVDVFNKLELVVNNFLNVAINFLGHLPSDPNVSAAVDSQTPFIVAFPKCSASAAIRMTARKLMHLDDLDTRNTSEGLLSRFLKWNKEDQ